MKKRGVNLKLYIGLIASFCIIILFSIIITLVGAITIKNVREDYSYTISIPEMKVRMLKDIKTDFMTMRYRVANYIMNSGDKEYIYKTAYPQYENAMSSLHNNLNEYIQLNIDDEKREKEITENNISNAEKFEDLISQYTVYAGEVMLLSAEGDARGADDVLKSVIPLAESSLALLDEMILSADENIRLIGINVDKSADNSIVFLITLASVLVFFAGVLSFTIIASIKKYIAYLRAAEFAAEEASRMKTSFLANMSHEIRTPMNGIIGFSELALDDNISPRTKDYLEKIKYSSEGLLHIINDILDVTKIEAGKMELENIPFNIHELFRICQAITAPKAAEKGITLFCYAEPSIGRKLLGDPTKLRQVLLNLLSNAVKFTNNGIVKLLSTVIENTENNVTMHFEIKDSGIGMSPEQISRVFEPFVQADESTTRRFGGTGLGLSLTKNIIELMGGNLLVESTLGVGSKFCFDLTFKTIGLENGAVEDDIKIDEFMKPMFDGEVLVCEDNDLNQQVIREHLERVGLKAIVAANGREGVEHVLRRMKRNEPPFDLIFMDIHMPVMDGLEAAVELNRIGNKTPIVALTANIMPNDREVYRMSGIPDCLMKPFKAHELWVHLLKYIIPSSLKSIGEKTQSEEDLKLYNQILSNFYKDNQTTFKDLNDAVKTGNIKLGHRLAHTLKGIAGLIGRTTLQEAAHEIERSLSDGNYIVTDSQLQVLEFELSTVLSELEQNNNVSKTNTLKTQPFDKEKIFETIKQLEPLLKAGDTDCLDMIADIAAIPCSEQLIEQIEGFNFASAVKTLNNIKLNLENQQNGKI